MVFGGDIFPLLKHIPNYFTVFGAFCKWDPFLFFFSEILSLGKSEHECGQGWLTLSVCILYGYSGSIAQVWAVQHLSYNSPIYFLASVWNVPLTLNSAGLQLRHHLPIYPHCGGDIQIRLPLMC